MPARLALPVLLALALAACGGDDAAPPATEPRPATATEQEPARDELELREPEVVASSLEVPWGLAFLPGGEILVTERPGRVRAIVDGELRDVGSVPGVVRRGEGGLLGVALHPSFEETRLVYLYYTAADGNRVSRFTLDEDLSLGDEHHPVSYTHLTLPTTPYV